MTTKPEQQAPNAFESAILLALARERPSLVIDVSRLRVLHRKYTGVGSYTDFACDGSGEREFIHLTAAIAVPGLLQGMGAVLYCRGLKPECLETFTCGEELWTGGSEGFSVG